MFSCLSSLASPFFMNALLTRVLLKVTLPTLTFSRVFDVLYEFCSWLAFTTFISPAFPSKSSWRPLQILLKVNIDNLPFCCLSFYKFYMFFMASTSSAQGRRSQLSFLLPVRLISSWRPLRVLLTVGSHNFLVSCLSILVSKVFDALFEFWSRNSNLSPLRPFCPIIPKDPVTLSCCRFDIVHCST